MEITSASVALSALGHPARLSVFRLLMRHAPQGARPTEIAQSLDLKPNTLSHHLADLEQAGLVKAGRKGRSIYYAADLNRAAALIGYLANDCCRGRPDIWPPLAMHRKDPQMPRVYNVLFICSGNSARSIFAEAILNHVAKGRFHGFSAGTRPGSQLNPFAVEILARAGMNTDDLRSKHVSAFQAADAPVMDFVFTVCDAAADEDCAPWPGQPLTAHWGLPDPVKASGTEAEKALAFSQAFAELYRRVTAFAALSPEQLDRVALQRSIDTIGHPQT